MPKRFIDADTEEVIDPQVGYVDGYGMADRLLEGVLFEITLDENGNAVCNGVHESFKDYCSKFSKAQMAEWCREAAEEGSIECLMDFEGKRDLFIEDVPE